jgi:hypothetical protein
MIVKNASLKCKVISELPGHRARAVARSLLPRSARRNGRAGAAALIATRLGGSSTGSSGSTVSRSIPAAATTRGTARLQGRVGLHRSRDLHCAPAPGVSLPANSRVARRVAPTIATIPTVLVANLVFSTVAGGAATRAGSVVSFLAVAFIWFRLIQAGLARSARAQRALRPDQPSRGEPAVTGYDRLLPRTCVVRVSSSWCRIRQQSTCRLGELRARSSGVLKRRLMACETRAPDRNQVIGRPPSKGSRLPV